MLLITSCCILSLSLSPITTTKQDQILFVTIPICYHYNIVPYFAIFCCNKTLLEGIISLNRLLDSCGCENLVVSGAEIHQVWNFSILIFICHLYNTKLCLKKNVYKLCLVNLSTMFHFLKVISKEEYFCCWEISWWETSFGMYHSRNKQN